MLLNNKLGNPKKARSKIHTKTRINKKPFSSKADARNQNSQDVTQRKHSKIRKCIRR